MKNSEKSVKKSVVKIQVAFDKNSRKGTYHRYQIQPNEAGMVGTLYFNARAEVPDRVEVEVLETEN